MNGLILVDKPIGPTSTDVVRAVRKAFDTHKVGHTGTLDPHASGLLPVTVGACTRLAKFHTLEPKVYSFDVVFGSATDTGDAGGTRVAAGPADVERNDVEDALDGLVGTISQVPPRYSAIRVGGKRAYDLARKGEEFDMKARTVRIEALELDRYDDGVATLRVRCGSGTYVRSLATDIADAVGTVAHARDIRRLRVGQWRVGAAVPLETLQTTADAARFLMSPLEMMEPLSQYELSEDQLRQIVNGNRIRTDSWPVETDFVALTCNGRLAAVAVAATERDSVVLQPRRVMRD